MKSAKKIHKIYGKEEYCASKTEARVGEWLILEGYDYLHDKEYDYTDVDKKYRYDFMLLNKSDKPDNITTKHHIYIEVKSTIKEISDLLKEKNFVEEHEDILVTFYDEELIENVFKNKLAMARKRLDLLNENRNLKMQKYKNK